MAVATVAWAMSRSYLDIEGALDLEVALEAVLEGEFIIDLDADLETG